MTETESGPPAGFETKNTPGYVPATVVSGDHPGHAVGFAGKAGYTNTPGIDDPSDNADSKSGGDDSKSTTKTSGMAVKTPAK